MFDWQGSATAGNRRDFFEVNKACPCPICDRTKWCAISEDGQVAMCMRQPDGAFSHRTLPHGEAHFHQISGQAPAAEGRQRTNPHASFRRNKLKVCVDFDGLLHRWGKSCGTAPIQAEADKLGLPFDSLADLRTTWSEHHKALAFPMHDGKGRTVGIRLRYSDGRKGAVNGTNSGIFLAGREAKANEWIAITEGPTDSAAARSLGFPVIGRPSCSGGVEAIGDFLARRPPRKVVIITDNDPPNSQTGCRPGPDGAARLAKIIGPICQAIRFVVVPAQFGDLRKWYVEGRATAQDIAERMSERI